MTARLAYGLNVDDLDGANLADVIALLLGLVEDDVVTFETDIPAPTRVPWPPRVEAAASTLLAASSRRRQQPGYGTTGLLRRGDAAVWDAFVTFAPYAYCASASDGRARAIVDVNDEGDSVWFALTAEQCAAAIPQIAPARLEPLSESRGPLRRLLRRRAGEEPNPTAT